MTLFTIPSLVYSGRQSEWTARLARRRPWLGAVADLGTRVGMEREEHPEIVVVLQPSERAERVVVGKKNEPLALFRRGQEGMMILFLKIAPSP